MTAAVLERPTSQQGDAVAGDGMTLEELLNAALREARTNGCTECPVCHARMTSARAREAGGPEVARAAEDFAAECGGCGSRLS